MSIFLLRLPINCFHCDKLIKKGDAYWYEEKFIYFGTEPILCSKECFDLYYKQKKGNNQKEKEIRDQFQKEKDKIEEIQKKSDEYFKKSTEEAIKNLTTCAGCQKDISQEDASYYASDPTKYYCSNCKLNMERGRTSSTNSSSSSYPSTSTPNYTPPPSNSNSTSTSESCRECKKTISIGHKVYVWPHEPNKKYCESCGIQQELIIEHFRKIVDGTALRTEIENDKRLNERNRAILTIALHIKNGGEINIDSLALNEEEKQLLKEFQKECGNPSSLPSKSSIYIINCKDCNKTVKQSTPISKCPNCNSSDLITWKDGKQQITEQDRKQLNKILFWSSLFWIVLIGLVIWLIVHWRRKRKQKRLLEQANKS